jgi:hypothetical protein
MERRRPQLSSDRRPGLPRASVAELLWALVATLLVLYAALRWGAHADVPPLRITD